MAYIIIIQLVLLYLCVLPIFWEATTKYGERLFSITSCRQITPAIVLPFDVVFEDIQGSIIFGQKQKITIFSV